MLVLGINPSHNGTACLMKDGKVIYCVSEERLTRVKNQSGIPYTAIKEILKRSKTKPSEIDKVAFSFKDMSINTSYSVLDNHNSSESYLWKAKEMLLSNFDLFKHLYIPLQKFYYENFVYENMKQNLLSKFEKNTKISKEKIHFYDHHSTHAATAFYGSEKTKNRKLVLTLDAMGDGICATVSIGENGSLKTIAETSVGNSLGDLYAYITRYLGMKMGEHEYKVMGLAAYANPDYVDKVYKKIEDWITVDTDNLEFKSKYYSHVFYSKLDKVFKNERFDNISGAIQKLVELRMTEWVDAAVKKTGIHDVYCAGGVFMNVKANQRIAELDSVNSLYIFPSGGDESTAIGAAYLASEKQIPIKETYFGFDYKQKDIDKLIKKISKKYNVKKYKNTEKAVARLLSKKKIVARFAGRMEWGARALGNRSIITHPQNLEGVRDINEQIKNRDFWMPFAPSMRSESMNKYIANPKKVLAPYMIISFDSKEKGKKQFRAAVHQYDFTARPQEVIKEYNPRYHALISEFEKLTGIGGVLNTSFNLHGYPIVESPEDALYVFENSGLEYLALENYIIQK